MRSGKEIQNSAEFKDSTNLDSILFNSIELEC